MNKEIELVPPGDAIGNLYRRLPGNVKFAFFSTFIMGLLVHMFFLNGLYFNHDGWGGGMIATPGYWGIALGRWAQGIVPYISGGWTKMPWLIGLYAFMNLSFISALLTYLFNVKRKLYILFLGLALVSFPTTTVSFAYHGRVLLLSVLLCVIGVVVIHKQKKGFFVGAILFSLSLGLYQANIFMASALFLILILIDMITNKDSAIILIKRGCKYLGAIIVGLVIYYVVLKVFLHIYPVELSSYQGVGNVGNYEISMFPQMVYDIYFNFFNMYYSEPIEGLYAVQAYRMMSSVLPYIYTILGVLAVAVFIYLLISNKVYKKFSRLVISIVLLLLFPVASNGVYALDVIGTSIYELMLYPMVTVIIICIVFMNQIETQVCKEKLENNPKPRLGRNIISTICWVQCVLLIFVYYNYVLIANEAYVKSYIATEQAISFSGELCRDIYNTPGYEKGMPIYRIGIPAGDFARTPYIISDLDDGIRINSNTLTGFPTFSRLIYSYTYPDFLKTNLGLDFNFVAFPTAEFFDEYESETVKMPVYPETGSIQIIDGNVFVKLEITP